MHFSTSGSRNRAHGEYTSDGMPVFVPEITTPLPLPGEYIVLQLNPVAMSKHLNRIGLTKAFRTLEFKRYLAIVLDVRERHIV